jgi:hypothetical protein
VRLGLIPDCFDIVPCVELVLCQNVRFFANMSKVHTAAPPQSETAAERLAVHFAKAAAAQAAQMIKKVGAIVAMLYIRGDNGRMSGRASGNVYMRNGRSRQFVVPRLVQNSYTSGARSLFSSFSSAWSTLTTSQQNTWNNVNDVFKSDRFGNPVLIRGKQLYIERNCNLVGVGIAAINTYVNPVVMPTITTLTPTGTEVAGLLTVLSNAFAPSPTDATVNYKVYATPALSNGIQRPRSSQFRLISIVAHGQSTPYNALTAYTTKFGTFCPANSNIFFKWVPVSITTGQMGTPIQAMAHIV